MSRKIAYILFAFTLQFLVGCVAFKMPNVWLAGAVGFVLMWVFGLVCVYAAKFFDVLEE